ncbi:MAG: acyloxyacyl hydrolase [Alphaproteobacteria bacterium]|nr:acyloxyacyl hydrolase [Alphaproteobacteria bacterium]
MKKIAIIFSLAVMLAGFSAFAESAKNTFTRHYKNQIAFNFGQGIDSGFLLPPPLKPVPFYLLQLQYSQPTTFFGLPARQSLNIGQTVGFGAKYGWNWDKYTIPMVLLSGDVRLSEYKNFYVSAGAGVGMQAQQNDRLGAKLLFQFKLVGGYHINDVWALELFMQHFSNGNTAPENYSYAFYGLGVTYNF